jgi:hypothetical protein
MAKWIYRNYPKGYEDKKKFDQDVEFNKDIIKAIKEEGKLNRKQAERSSGKSSVGGGGYSGRSSGVKIEYTKEQMDNTKMIIGGIFCFLFPPFGFWVLFNSIKRHYSSKTKNPEKK